MNQMPNIFKPGINKKLNNNDRVYYSGLNENNLRSAINNSNDRNIVNDVLINKKYGIVYKIVTKNNVYNEKIVDRMGQNIILSNNKVIPVNDIVSIYNN